VNALRAVSIVVPVCDESSAAAETLRSLAEQDYPQLEVVEERDNAIAAALNRGFARCRGEILAYVRPGEMLLPGTLHRVAGHFDAPRARPIVFGRSVFVLEAIGEAGVEHPAQYLGAFDHLAIWRRGFDPVPRASLFWHRSVADRIGGFPPLADFALDYDLVCRAERHFPIHKVDELWSAVRIQGSPFGHRTDAEVLHAWVEVSRRHWGSWLEPMRWRCELSYALHQLDLHERARHHARRAEDAAAEGRRPAALLELLRAMTCSPRMAWERSRTVYRRGFLRKS
jgi:glycosyltransferase involved in cell wall biosynthesis